MRTPWNSIERLTSSRLVVLWVEVGATIIGGIAPNASWLFWVGVAVTSVGVLLEHRAEHLKRLLSAPRRLSSEQAGRILESLEQVPKRPLTVGFLGHNPEAKQYAIQIKGLLESAGFQVARLDGFLAFELRHDLELTVYNSESNNPAVLGIRDAFLNAGLPIRIQTSPNRMEPAIMLSVHAKGPPTPNEEEANAGV